MEVFEVEDKVRKEKVRGVSTMSVLGDMAELEDYSGVTAEKILDNWYELKRRLREALTVELPKEK